MTEQEYPWRDESTLRKLYVEEEMSTREMGEKMGVDKSTISKWLEKFNIEKRNYWHNYDKPSGNLSFYETNDGYFRIDHRFNENGRATIQAHRLVAIAKFGYENVANKVVHHKNGCKLDNRPANLELMSSSEHSKHHIEEQERDENGNFI